MPEKDYYEPITPAIADEEEAAFEELYKEARKKYEKLENGERHYLFESRRERYAFEGEGKWAEGGSAWKKSQEKEKS